jgi:hypothetical protein
VWGGRDGGGDTGGGRSGWVQAWTVDRGPFVFGQGVVFSCRDIADGGSKPVDGAAGSTPGRRSLLTASVRD